MKNAARVEWARASDRALYSARSIAQTLEDGDEWFSSFAWIGGHDDSSLHSALRFADLRLDRGDYRCRVCTFDRCVGGERDFGAISLPARARRVDQFDGARFQSRSRRLLGRCHIRDVRSSHHGTAV